MNKLKDLARTIVNYSLEVEEDENVLIKCETIEPMPLVKELVKEIKHVKANVMIKITDPTLNSLITEATTDSKIDLLQRSAKFEVENFDCFINIKCNQNDYEEKNIDNDITRRIGEKLSKYNDIRTNERRWVLLNYPSNVDAYKAKMTTKEYYDYALNVMCYDYKKMAEAIEPLKELMEKTDMVRITGIETDITFSIKNMNIIPCVGECNIPDGEIYCAPIKKSVNGVIKYNTKSPYQGNVYEGVKLVFKDGEIVKATCDNKENFEKLNEIFDTDKGSRYIGEFSIGLNPKIKYPMGDILFDEKIIGSIHFTPGRAYKDSYNGNDSSIHWDMVLIQRKDFGGGDIYFDDVLIRKDGVFVLPELKHLNK